jgi:hypothetical protein
MRFWLLVLALVLAGPLAARADGGFGLTLGYTFPVYEHLGPSLDIRASQVQAALQAAFEIKPKLSLGVLVSVRQHQIAVPAGVSGEYLDAVAVIPVNALAYYHPLEKMFDPYLVGQIGPVVTNEQYRDGSRLTTRWAVGPMLGFGVGVDLRLPVSPLLEARCELGLPAGDRVKNLALCGATVGILVGFD